MVGITKGVELGYGVTSPHGTEGYVRDLFIRDLLNAGTVAFDVTGNVGIYDTITTYNSAIGIRIVGAANMAQNLIPYGCTQYGAYLQLTNVTDMELEAPGNSCVPLYLAGNASIKGLSISLANNTTISHLIELSASA